MEFAVPVGVARADLSVGDAEIHHHLSSQDVQVFRVAVAEVLGVVGSVGRRLVGHSGRGR